MLLKSAECPNCFSQFPLGAGVFRLKLPPLSIQCGHCGLWLKTTFAYRATWTSGLVMKVVLLLALFLCMFAFVVYVQEGKGVGLALAISAVGFLFLGGLGSLFAGMVLYLPVQIVLEPLIRLLPNKQDLASAPELRAATTPPGPKTPQGTR